MRGIVLSGGGARGAYQVGVLKAISEIVEKNKISKPFDIYTGVSAGAINASFMAAGSDDFTKALKNLENIWANISVKQVFKTDVLSIGKIGFKWVEELSLGGLTGATPGRALLDTAPLFELIGNNLDFKKIQDNISKKNLFALAITALDYKTSESITFVQGDSVYKDWERSRRHSERTIITPNHICASSAIPVLFPPVKIDDRFFGDGCVRNLMPCSPAIHLGATKLLIIGVRKQNITAYDERILASNDSPSVARVVNVLLNAILLDSVDVDIERLSRINEFVSKIPTHLQDKVNFSKIDFTYVSPSEDIGMIAESMADRLPRVIRYLLKGLGPVEDASEIISYLLFDTQFCSYLMDVGYKDGIKLEKEILEFLQN